MVLNNQRESPALKRGFFLDCSFNFIGIRETFANILVNLGKADCLTMNNNDSMLLASPNLGLIIITMKKRQFFGVLISAALLNACSGLPKVNIDLRESDLPANWSNQNQYLSVNNNWLQEFSDAHLQQLVEKALSNNPSLKQQALQIEIEKQRLLINGAAFLPSLDLSARTARSKSTQPTSYQTSSSASLNVAYEVDVWGKLSDAQKQSNLTYLAQKSTFEQGKQQLVADVVTAWFNVLSAQQLSALYQSRVTNAEQNLDIIEQGYQQGLNEALDVYLARNSLHSERSNLAQQLASQAEAVRVLERLVGDYPTGLLNINKTLPLIDGSIPKGLPSELITRKPELVASWYQLLAKDAALAYAHKQRFPSLNLSASVSSNGENLGDVFSPSALAWSLIGSVAAPIFNGGELKANEQISLLSLKQGEQQYLDTLYSALTTVENAIGQERTLRERYQATLAASENAMIAEELSFEQYRSGLVTYTTVLDAQGRSFDAQSSLINLKNQLIANRIALHVALGGDFTTADNTKSEQ